MAHIYWCDSCNFANQVLVIDLARSFGIRFLKTIRESKSVKHFRSEINKILLKLMSNFEFLSLPCPVPNLVSFCGCQDIFFTFLLYMLFCFLVL